MSDWLHNTSCEVISLEEEARLSLCLVNERSHRKGNKGCLRSTIKWKFEVHGGCVAFDVMDNAGFESACVICIRVQVDAGGKDLNCVG